MQEYTDQAKLKELVTKYSEFINYPIYLWTSKEVDVPVEEDEEDEKEKEGAKEDADKEKEEGAEDVEDEDGEWLLVTLLRATLIGSLSTGSACMYGYGRAPAETAAI